MSNRTKIELNLRFLKSNKPASSSESNLPTYEFHISKKIRKKYDLNKELFSITGNVIFADFQEVRFFTHKINLKRDDKNKLQSGEVNAAGLIDEIYHFIIRKYEIDVNPGALARGVDHISKNLGETTFHRLLFEFVKLFPPSQVYNGQIGVLDYLHNFTEGKPNTEIVLEELMMLHLANINPANKNLIELFDENYFENKTTYEKAIKLLDDFFKKEKNFGPDDQDIFTLLKTPFLKNPDNLEAQLNFIFDYWGIVLGDKFGNRILSSLDLMKEGIIFNGEAGREAPTAAPVYNGEGEGLSDLTLGKSGYQFATESSSDYEESEQFTQDIDWMPKVVLMAKNVYVWLDQISKKYGRHIHRLDQIPDEELDRLAEWNFTGLWLIGLWERSNASKQIKHNMGNTDAVASAYSLFDYEIANDLGGEEAYQNLNSRASKRGIRLASDMVPNHTGIFSKWIIDHPEYFIQSDKCPFPNYTFTGPDYSDDPNIEIKIEDGYRNHTDAAVVFQRIDKRNGDVKYIYHGNDGTNMPWNDTAQLNMLKHEVREAVIQKIMDVARKFSIIRFDAAMTLTKRHFARLWYPQPGTGGDIPSRADHALPKSEFDKLFPNEFWREVVDRINNEMPGTLLLAEAFWMLEGYFVRTLGMHRVYNSAFMHMLMNEENDKYRDLITNTLEFEPEILKRYVNFMSNPDEETAIKQFGTDDKYFGVALLMVTLPGLPMFGHGQIEGYTEKYGMEYKRAYYNEQPNQWLQDRHKSEIFPLMKKRYLFSQVRDFWFFDFNNDFGGINENVFAYTNMSGDERSLIFFNNKYESATGYIYNSTPKLVSYNQGENKKLETKTLSEALKIRNEDKYYYVYTDSVSRLQFIKSGREIIDRGFRINLGAFKHNAFIDFNEVYDTDGYFEQLERSLQGNGVDNLFEMADELKFEKIHNSFKGLYDETALNHFIEVGILLKDQPDRKDISIRYGNLLKTINNHFGCDLNSKDLIADVAKFLEASREINFNLENGSNFKRNRLFPVLRKSVVINRMNNYKENSLLFFMWLTLMRLETALAEKLDKPKLRILEHLHLENRIKDVFNRLGMGEEEVKNEMLLLQILLKFKSETQNLTNRIKGDAVQAAEKSPVLVLFSELLDDADVKEFINLNLHNDIWYFSKENFEHLINWFTTAALVAFVVAVDDTNIEERMEQILAFSRNVKITSEKSGYQFITLKKNLNVGEFKELDNLA